MYCGYLGRCVLLMWIVFIVGEARADYYGQMAIGVSNFSIERADSEFTDSSIGSYFRVSGGLSAKHSLQFGLSLRGWAANDEDDDDDGDGDELIEHFFLHDFHFSSISVGADVQMYIPGFRKGPYVRYGRHCWLARVFDYRVETSENACGHIWAVGVFGGGLMVDGQASDRGGVLLELEYTRMNNVDTLVGILGMQI